MDMGMGIGYWIWVGWIIIKGSLIVGIRCVVANGIGAQRCV